MTYDEQDPAYGIYADGCTYAVAPLQFANPCAYDYGNFENAQSGALGLAFNQIGKINPDGTTGFLITMNYDGEYLRVKQLQDGTFLTVGSTTATRKRIDAPQNGKPLYYNPTVAQPNNYFKRNEIFGVGNINPPIPNRHWDAMKFDGNGTCLFDNLYGLTDFNNTATTNYPIGGVNHILDGKQLAYYSVGNAYDFVQEPNSDICMVGLYTDPQNGAGRGAMIKINSAGKVLASCFIDDGTNVYGAVARAVEFATIGGIDYYIVAVTQGTAINTIVNIYAMPTSLVGSPVLLHTFTPTSTTKVTSTVWSLSVKNNQLYFPLITNCSNVWYSGDNSGDLNIVKLNLNDFNPSTNLLSNTTYTTVHAFDLKARMIDLSDGNFAVVGAVQNTPWSSLGCSTPPGYIMNNAGQGCTGGNYSEQTTGYWNTDTYVAKSNANGIKIWDKTFDSNTPFTCTDYPTSFTSGGGDPKRQECMYGVSEAPDGGIVVSGNASPNVDDNYMAKLYSDCNTQQPYDITGILNINSTVTWNTSHKVNGIIRVNQGGVLNITGITTLIEFADSKQTGTPARIEVYGNGRVNINGATLTSVNCPNSMWEGIQIYGNGNGNPQTITLQPSITLSNATLKNARLGIANGMDIAPAGPAPYSSGGWVTANNSTFLNNYIDVDFLPYAAPLVAGNEPNNKSIFTNCTFKADNYLNDPSYIQQVPGTPNRSRLVSAFHVRLDGVKGVRFIGNTFKNDLSAVGGTSYVTNFRGTGIYSSNSTFDVYSTCLLQDQYGNCTGYGPTNTFENLLYGVLAGSTSPLKKFSITKATFKNCNSSIYQSGVNYSTVNKNNFIVDAIIPSVAGNFNCSANPQACMTHFYYANNSSGFSHQENNYTVTGTQQVMGTVFNGSGTAANESYKNKYTNCYIGHQSQLTNGANTGLMNGLQIKCNENLSTKQYDVRQTSGVLGQQGTCLSGDPKSPSNNTFSHFQANPPSDINGTNGSGFSYKFNNSPPTGQQVPFYVTGNINVSSPCLGLAPFSYNATTCPSKLTNTSGSGELPGSAIAKLQTDALNNKQVATQLNQVLINGASQNLINAIASSTNDGNLKNLLSQYSPYLSDEVLIDYLKKAQTPPNGHIKQIVVENSPVTAKVMEVIDAMSLSNGIRNQINNAQIGTSARAQREQEIAYYNFQKDLNVNEIVRYYLDDTTTANTYANIIKWLEWNNTKPSKIDLVFAKTETADYNRAQFLIDSLSADTGNIKFIPFLQVNKDMSMQGKTWDSLQTDASATSIIETIANDSLHPHMGHARAALAHAFKNKKHYEFIEGSSNNAASRVSNNSFNESQKNSIEGINLIAYPNPFKDELNINYSILDFEGVAQLQLIELATGRLIDDIELTQSFGTKQFNTQNLANGLYVLSLKQNNKPTVNFKVINIK
ncbi:MAG: T9SS type A sorting domain-containing protein [Bacteroidia bacterium]|nr:T9SS type A sorting domain-containing protein [Bacteroidia bacterium]